MESSNLEPTNSFFTTLIQLAVGIHLYGRTRRHLFPRPLRVEMLLVLRLPPSGEGITFLSPSNCLTIHSIWNRKNRKPVNRETHSVVLIQKFLTTLIQEVVCVPYTTCMFTRMSKGIWAYLHLFEISPFRQLSNALF